MKAMLYETSEGEAVRCTACRRYCTLKPGQTGFCGVRKNVDGALDLLVHSMPMGMNIDPIEKKPILHAYPGSRVLSFGTSGCNFACKFCQNYDMSQRRDIVGRKTTPEEIVETAIRNGCQGIAYTYNEPTIFIEFAEEVGKIAHRNGLFNIFVTNGYETPEAVDSMKRFLDFATVDFKGNASTEFYRKYISIGDPGSIFDTLSQLKETDIHVELTDLVIPEIGDNIHEARLMISHIVDIFGDDIPMCFLRFHPDYLLNELPVTPLVSLMEHYDLAREMGMNYVYIGNVPGIREQNTYCPGCRNLLVQRDRMRTVKVNLLPESTCPECGKSIPFILKNERTSIGKVDGLVFE